MALTNIAYKIHYTCGKDIQPSYDLIYDNQNLTYDDLQLTYHKSSSESFLPLGRDGDYFEVSGYTNIEEMRSLGVGMQVVLVFETSTTLVHSENLILPEDKNINTNPHHAYRFIEYDIGKWKMLVSDTISSTFDTSAVHVNIGNEINLIDSKESIKLDDTFIIEDSEDNWNKKKFSGYQIARTGREEKIGPNSDYEKSNYIYEDFPEGFILERFPEISTINLHNLFVMSSVTYVSGYQKGSNKQSIIGNFLTSGSIDTHVFSTIETDVLGSFDIIAYDASYPLRTVLYAIEKTTNHTEKFILKLSGFDDYEKISIGTFPSATENPSCLIFCENYYNILIGTDGGRILKGGGSPWNVVYPGWASATVRKIIQTGSSAFIALLFDSDTNTCSLLKTNDSGGNWVITASDLPDLKNICFSFQSYIIGISDKEIYIFKEDKDNFSSILTVTDETLKAVHYLGNGTIFVAGDQTGVSYDLWFSYDFGSTWKHSKINNPYEIISTFYSSYIDGIRLLIQKTTELQSILFIPTNQMFFDFGVSFSEFENTDTTAIHKETPREIVAITPKEEPIGTDVFLIEDSDPSLLPVTYNGIALHYDTEPLSCVDTVASWSKKSISLMSLNLPGIDSMAYHSNLPGEYDTERQGQKLSPVGADRLIIEDSESGWIKKFIEIDDIPANNVDPTAIHLDSTSPEIGTLSFDSILPEDVLVIEKADGTKRKLAFSSIPTAHDADAIHRSVPNEISLIDELTTPENDDYVVIEVNDPIEGNRVKKKVQLANLPTSGGGEVNFGINSGTGSIAWYDRKDGSGLIFRTLDVDKNTGLDWVFQDDHYTLSIAKEPLKVYLSLDLDDIADSETYSKVTNYDLAIFYSGALTAGTAFGLASYSQNWILQTGQPIIDQINNFVIPQINYLNDHVIDHLQPTGTGIEILQYLQVTRALKHKTINTGDNNFLQVTDTAAQGIVFTAKNLVKQAEDNQYGNGLSLIYSFNKNYGENHFVLRLRKIKSLNQNLLPLQYDGQGNLEIDIKDVVTELRKIGNDISVLKDLERTDDGKFYRIPVKTISSEPAAAQYASSVVLLEDAATDTLLLRGRSLDLENIGNGEGNIGKFIESVGGENEFKAGTAHFNIQLKTLSARAGIEITEDEYRVYIRATGFADQNYYVPLGGYGRVAQPTDLFDELVCITTRQTPNLLYWPGVFEKAEPTQPPNAYFHRTINNPVLNINGYGTKVASHVTFLSVRPQPNATWDAFALLSPYLEPRHTLRPNFLQISGLMYRKPKPNTASRIFKKCIQCAEKVTENMFTLIHDGLGFIEFPFFNNPTVEEDVPVSIYRGVVDTSDVENEEDLGYNLFASLKANNVQQGDNALSLTLSSYEGYEGAIINLNFDSSEIQGALIYNKPNQFIPEMEYKPIPDHNDLLIIEDSQSNPQYQKKFIRLSDLPEPPDNPPVPFFPESPWDKDSRRWWDKPIIELPVDPLWEDGNFEPGKGGIKILTPIFWFKVITFPFKGFLELGDTFEEFYVYFKSTINDDVVKFTIPSPQSTLNFDVSSSQSGVMYVINETELPEKFITVFVEENEGVTNKNKIIKNVNKSLKEDFAFSQYSLGTFNYNENPRCITWTHETDSMLIGTYVKSLIPTEDSIFKILKGSVDSWNEVYSSMIQDGEGGITNIIFIDLNTCIAIINETHPQHRSILLKSENNGDTWASYSIINDICFDNLLLINNEKIIGKEENKLYISTDKGLTFGTIPIWDKAGYEINDIAYISYNMAVIGGKNDSNYPFLAITQNGGESWEENSFTNLDMSSFEDITFEPENNNIYCLGSLTSDPKIKKIYASSLPEITGVNDDMAFHLDKGGEIDSLDEKINLSPNDMLIIEDSENDNEKKKTQVRNFGATSLQENKSAFAGSYFPYGMLPITADNWPYARLDVEYQASSYPPGYINSFNVCVDGTKIAIGRVEQAGYVQAAIFFSYGNSSIWASKLWYGTLGILADGLTNMTITPHGDCYFSLRDGDTAAPSGNRTILTTHQSDLEHLTEIELPTSFAYYYQTAITYIPCVENEVLVARAVLPQYASPGLIEIYRITNNTPTRNYYYTTSPQNGFAAIQSFMIKSKDFITAIRSNYYDGGYTVFLKYDIENNLWEELSRYNEAAFNKCVYIGNDCYVAISDYGIFISNDDGNTWNKKYETEYKLYDISYLGYNSLIASGSDEGNYSVILFSFDFGNSWQEQKGIVYSSGDEEKYKITSLFPGRFNKKIYGVGDGIGKKVISMQL